MDRIEKIVSSNGNVKAEVVKTLESVLGSNTAEQYTNVVNIITALAVSLGVNESYLKNGHKIAFNLFNAKGSAFVTGIFYSIIFIMYKNKISSKH